MYNKKKEETVSITQRLQSIKNHSSFINTTLFETIRFNDEITLNKEENIDRRIIGIAVDYLSRYIYTKDNVTSFRVSLRGADILGELDHALEIVSKINENLDDETICAACELARYDVATRIGPWAYERLDNIEKPDKNTIENIRTMVRRSEMFFLIYGPIVKFDFTLGDGYGPYVNRGDGDFLTKNTIWDMKVSHYEVSSKYALQLLIYYIMGKRSSLEEFKSIEFVGIFNPRLNEISILNMYDVSDITIEKIIKKVLKESN